MSKRKLFDDWAESYDETLEDSAGFPFEGYEQVLGKIVGGAGVGAGDRILDVGTGTGALAARFAELDCHVLGVDLSAKMLQQARRNVANAEFRELDLLGDWDGLETRHFEVIVSAYVFHEFELETKLELLTRLAGSLRPGGRVVISFATAEARAAAWKKWQSVWDESEHYWVAEKAPPLLEQQGFKADYIQVSFCAGVYTLSS